MYLTRFKLTSLNLIEICSGSCLISEQVLVKRKLDLDVLITSLVILNQCDTDVRQTLSFLMASSHPRYLQNMIMWRHQHTGQSWRQVLQMRGHLHKGCQCLYCFVPETE